MILSGRKVTFAGLAGVVSLLMSDQQAHAGPFIDWLLGRPILAYPSPYVAGYPSVPAAVPVPAVPAVSAPTFVAPAAQTTYYAPPYSVAAPCTVAPTACAPAACAVPAAACPVAAPITVAQPVIAAPVAQSVVVGYAPTYRTNWIRVPVTYYRPVPTYNVSGYPAVSAVPCNTYGWQAQRVPTIRYRPWVPFVPSTYGYAPAATTYGYAPISSAVVAPAAIPACQACPVTSPALATAPYSTAAPTYGAIPATAPLGVPAEVPGTDPGTGYPAPAADQAPSLSPGSYPVSPASDASVPSSASVLGTGVAPATPIPADSASTRREFNSPYRVTPIPAPDLRTFEAQRGAPQAPPLLPGRERTVFNSAAQTTNLANASWTTTRPPQNAPAAAASPSPAKLLWNDGGWRTAK